MAVSSIAVRRRRSPSPRRAGAGASGCFRSKFDLLDPRLVPLASTPISSHARPPPARISIHPSISRAEQSCCRPTTFASEVWWACDYQDKS
uniref:Uncharacterized protein n=1 Tax=Leersia perrieri TaxID=77586 RepID=A0A0D9WK18_9ORYZ